MRKAPPHPAFKVVARNLRRYRKAKGLSQQALMEMSGESSVKQIEAHRQGAEVATLANLAEALGIGISDLFAESESVASRELRELRERLRKLTTEQSAEPPPEKAAPNPREASPRVASRGRRNKKGA